MVIEPQPEKPGGRERSRFLRGHALGLLGANLAVGALALSAFPLALGLCDLDDAAMPLFSFLAPSAPDAGLTAFALILGALLLGAFAAGIALVIHAAHVLGGGAD